MLANIWQISKLADSFNLLIYNMSLDLVLFVIAWFWNGKPTSPTITQEAAA